jgi:hypothetical protein
MKRTSVLLMIIMLGLLFLMALSGCGGGDGDGGDGGGRAPAANSSFNGTFSGNFTTTQGGEDFVGTITMTLTVGSPLSGTFRAGDGTTGTISGEAEGNSATFSATIEGVCPGSFSGSMTLEGDTLSFNGNGSDCEGPFTSVGTLNRVDGAVPLSLEQLSGTYRLVDFTVTQPDGTIITPNDIGTFSGTYMINPDGSATQDVTADGVTIIATGTISVIDNDTIQVNNNEINCTNNLEVSLVDNILTTFLSLSEARRCGLNFSETDVWERTGAAAALGATRQLQNPVTSGVIGASVGSTMYP